MHASCAMLKTLTVALPELDVVVDLSGSTVTNYDDLRAMLYDGLITQETFGTTVFKQRNMPMEQMVNLKMPDNVDERRLFKPEKDDLGAKTKQPPHKKHKK